MTKITEGTKIINKCQLPNEECQLPNEECQLSNEMEINISSMWKIN